MTILDYMVCGLVALVGGGIHFVTDMNSSRKLALKGNYEWTKKQYLNDQMLAAIASFLWVVFVALVFTEVVAKYEQIFDWKRLIFGVMGYAGDSFAIKVLGKASDRALAVIDNKTSQIDEINNTKEQPTPAVMPTDKPTSTK